MYKYLYGTCTVLVRYLYWYRVAGSILYMYGYTLLAIPVRRTGLLACTSTVLDLVQMTNDGVTAASRGDGYYYGTYSGTVLSQYKYGILYIPV